MTLQNNGLCAFSQIVRRLSEKYNVPYEVVEAILRDWQDILTQAMKD